MDTKELEQKSKYLRNRVLDMCVKAGTGHVTSSFSCTEIMVALYYGGILRYDVANSKWENRDRFILSKGQASPMLYAVLGDIGFFPNKEIDKFCQADGIFGVHLQCDVNGVEITAGSLGHGLGIGAGMALAAKLDKKSYTTFVLLGDGECYEGSIWEAMMFASQYKLDNLVAIVDRNWLCATDFTENCIRLNPMDKKWKSFGWEVTTINGHSFDEIFSAIEEYRTHKSNKPFVIIANTIKGQGVSFMINKPLWHGTAPKGKQAKMAKLELQ